MSLSAGTRLGPYEIQSPLGAGGMGEVFKARDTRLERTVAIKVLPQGLAADSQFRERFEREARTISQLDDPHICALYDVGHENGTSYLVMQYLEGETLAARLQKGALPIADALKFGLQIANALDKAHRAGIIHRDLKPGNVMITKSGAKLLDFGLAKSSPVAKSGVTMMPTTPVSITAQGTILGTFQYMAPEQVEGQEADNRTDLFGFGAVLFEMVTGRQAFQGKTQASLVGSILRDDPTLSPDFPATLPVALSRIIRTCLAKNPDDRFQTAHDVALQLQWLLEGGSQVGVPAPAVTSAPAPRRSRSALVAWTVAGLATAAAGFLGFMVSTRTEATARTVRFDIASPPSVATVDAPRLSPDGRYLAFNATDTTGRVMVWIRQLNSLTAQPLAGTEGASRPFWSPDSRFVAFMANAKLQKVEISGGPPQKICDAPTGSDGSWSSDGVILYDGRGSDPIYRVSAAGGTPTIAVKGDPSRKETLVGWPEFLPDGQHFLYLAQNENPNDSAYRVGTLDSTDTQLLMPAQTQVAFAAPDRLLFVRDRTLMAQNFDAQALKLIGEAVPLAERIGTNTVGQASFSVSADGTLAYRTGEVGSQMEFVGLDGKSLENVGDLSEMGNPAFSRDGARLAFSLRDPRSGRFDVWVRDLVRGVSSRFTFGGADNNHPVWSPDGSRVAFSSINGGTADILEKPSSGQGGESALVKDGKFNVPIDWSRDGQYLAIQTNDPKTGPDVWVLPLFGDRKPIPIVATAATEQALRFSPDGHFVSYRSDESGTAQIYVQPFPNATGKWQVSNAGGTDATWSADGKQLFYRSPDQRMMAVEYKAGQEFQASIPTPLFPARVYAGGNNVRNRYAPAPDGKRFLVVAPPSRDSMVPTTVVLNWRADLGS